MSWSRFDDKFTLWPQWRGMPVPAKWLYVELINYCSRINQDDGRFPRVEVRRATDLDDDDTTKYLRLLASVGLLEMDEAEVFVVRMETDHAPPPHQRDAQRKSQQRKWQQAQRLRKCLAGEHSRHCPRSCPERGSGAGSRDGSGMTPGQGGAGQRRAGKTHLQEEQEGANEAGALPGTGSGRGYLLDARCRRTLA